LYVEEIWCKIIKCLVKLAGKHRNILSNYTPTFIRYSRIRTFFSLQISKDTNYLTTKMSLWNWFKNIIFQSLDFLCVGILKFLAAWRDICGSSRNPNFLPFALHLLLLILVAAVFEVFLQKLKHQVVQQALWLNKHPNKALIWLKALDPV